MLPILLNRPKDVEDWNRFTFNHRSSHELIRQAINKKFSVFLPDYQIDPFPFDVAPKQWLQNNQQYHTDMNSLLNTPGSDLEEVNLDNPRELEAWIYLHWQEHNVAENKLGIGS